jgi:molecular chaperone DnaK (HSP70)
MKVQNYFSLGLLYFFAIICLPFSVFAQGGFSSASVSHLRNSGTLPPSESVVVEEYMNYHRHQLPMPSAKEKINLDLRWGKEEANSLSEDAYLQVGFTTHRSADFKNIPPLNLCLIIDKSGSMAGSNRMDKVKEALKAFVGKLRPDDILSIITFNNEAQVLLSASMVSENNSIIFSIDSLYPGGGTNISSGIVLGYQELLKNYDPKRVNRALLLTDGLANIGELNPEMISQKPAEQNYIRDINLSAIGVGIEYNSDLLRQLVKSGKGQIHFVGDEDDIKKVFVDEIGSLLAPVARKVHLKLEYQGLDLNTTYGYSPIVQEKTVNYYLPDMNGDLTQVVLLKFNLSLISSSHSVKATLTYTDAFSQKKEELIKTINLPVKLNKDNKKGYVEQYKESLEMMKYVLQDLEVRKNVSIALLAQALKESAQQYENQQKEQSNNTLKSALTQVNFLFEGQEDKDVKYVKNILENIEKNN